MQYIFSKWTFLCVLSLKSWWKTPAYHHRGMKQEFLIINFLYFFFSNPTVPQVAPPPSSSKAPPQIPYPAAITFPSPTFPSLPSSLLPTPLSLQSPSTVVRSYHHLCQAVGHVRTRAKPGPSVHGGQHSSAQGILGLWVTCGWMGVNSDRCFANVDIRQLHKCNWLMFGICVSSFGIETRTTFSWCAS